MPCHGQLSVSAVKRGAVCRIGAEGVTPTIALLGDSHAGHLTPALTQDLAQQGAAALVFSRGWCAPLPGFGTDAPSRGPECAAFMEAAWRHVLTHPDIETIVLAAQWANFTEGTREGMARVTYADALDWRGNPAAFSAAMANLAETLHGKGRRLVLVEPVPEFAEPVPDALMRDAWREKTLTRVAPPVPFEGRNAPALATLAAFREETRALVLRPRDILCEKVDLCRVATEAGVPLYRDRGHLSSAGAALISEALVPLLKIR